MREKQIAAVGLILLLLALFFRRKRISSSTPAGERPLNEDVRSGLLFWETI